MPFTPEAQSSSSATRDQFRVTVRDNIYLCREHYRLILELPAFVATEPGQFIQLFCRPADVSYHSDRERDWQIDSSAIPDAELAGPLAFLRRPFSLAGRRDISSPGDSSHVELDVIHRVVGVGTDWLSRLKPGDVMDILGPLGNRFVLPPPGGLALLVGGGVGIPPMLYLAEALARAGNRAAVAFAGALSRDLLPLRILDDVARPAAEAEATHCIEEFARHGIPAVISTDDGSFGYRGFITQALEKWLDNAGFPAGGALHSRVVLYTCGPEPMMKRVAAIAAERGLACQVAVERAMACGMGTCQSCCIRVRKPDPAQPPLPGSDWCWRLACTDGPVFAGADLLW